MHLFAAMATNEEIILQRLPPPFQEMSFYTFIQEKKHTKKEVLCPSNIDNGQLC